MGATVFRYPKQYHSLLSSMRDMVVGARNQQTPAIEAMGQSHLNLTGGAIKMGLTFNFLVIDGNQARGESRHAWPFQMQGPEPTVCCDSLVFQDQIFKKIL